MAGLAASPTEDVGWQEGKQKPGKERGVERLNSVRLPKKASLLDELVLGNVIGNPEENVYFRTIPQDVREENQAQIGCSSRINSSSFLPRPTGVRLQVRSIAFKSVLSPEVLNKLAHPAPHPIWLPPESQGKGDHGGGGFSVIRHYPWTLQLPLKERTEINVLADFPLPT